MKIETKFSIWQKVCLLNLEKQPATVIEIKMDGNNLFYRVEYWWNGEVKTIYQSEWELAAYENKERSIQPATNKGMA